MSESSPKGNYSELFGQIEMTFQRVVFRVLIGYSRYVTQMRGHVKCTVAPRVFFGCIKKLLLLRVTRCFYRHTLRHHTPRTSTDSRCNTPSTPSITNSWVKINCRRLFKKEFLILRSIWRTPILLTKQSLSYSPHTQQAVQAPQNVTRCSAHRKGLVNDMFYSPKVISLALLKVK